MQKGGMFLLESADPGQIFTPEDFSDEHRMIAQTAANFVTSEVEPLTEELESKKAGLMRSLLEKAGEVGLFSADISQEYGGTEAGEIASAVISENLSMGGFAVSHGAHTGIGSLPIILFGNEEQKERYVPGLASGKLIAAYALTEPMAGSDAMDIQLKAVLSEDGKHYILNGEKMFTTNAGFADVFVTFAKVDGDKFTAFIVDRDTPGFSVGGEEEKLGIKGASTCSLVFEDAKVPVENVLGEIGEGHHIAFNILDMGRWKLGIGCMGASKSALALAAQYAMQRQQFGSPIGKFGVIKSKLAQIAAKIYASESVCYRLVGDMEEALRNAEGKDINTTIADYAVECAIAKIHGSEALDYVVDESLQIHGGYGYIKEYPLERFYRDARITRIFEGTNEIDRLLIPRTLLRRGMKGQLPLLRAAKDLTGELISLRPKVPMGDEGPLEIEFDMLDRAKKMVLMIGGNAAQKYMQKIAEEEEILEIMANMTIEVYAMESALLRAKKALDKEPASAESKVDLALAYVHDVFPKLEVWGKQALTYMFESGDILRGNLGALKRLGKFQTADLIGIRRRTADKILEAGRYVV